MNLETRTAEEIERDRTFDAEWHYQHAIGWCDAYGSAEYRRVRRIWRRMSRRVSPRRVIRAEANSFPPPAR